MAAKPKTFSLGGFLSAKSADGDLDKPTATADQLPATPKTDDRSSTPVISQNPVDRHDEPAALRAVVALVDPPAVQTVMPAPQPLAPPQHEAPSMDVATPQRDVVSLETARARKQPGPKGRGSYEKRTISIATDLDRFVNQARRNHVRPDGTESTIYSHFIEDLIVAEIHRRATR